MSTAHVNDRSAAAPTPDSTSDAAAGKTYLNSKTWNPEPVERNYLHRSCLELTAIKNEQAA